jgi:hypothetical protein
MASERRPIECTIVTAPPAGSIKSNVNCRGLNPVSVGSIGITRRRFAQDRLQKFLHLMLRGSPGPLRIPNRTRVSGDHLHLLARRMGRKPKGDANRFSNRLASPYSPRACAASLAMTANAAGLDCSETARVCQGKDNDFESLCLRYRSVMRIHRREEASPTGAATSFMLLSRRRGRDKTDRISECWPFKFEAVADHE